MGKEEHVCTIAQIAQDLGYSKSTVSRALAGKGRISRETVERIREYALSHHYTPNNMARGLVQHKTYNLGFIIPYDNSWYETYSSSFFVQCSYGVYEAASEYNYDVMMCIVDEGQDSKLQKLIANRKVDGLILSRSIEGAKSIKMIQQSNIPMVLIGPPGKDGAVSVDNPNQEASSELTEIMLLKGVKNICLIGGNDSYCVNQVRRQGFLDTCRAFGMAKENIFVFMGVNTVSEARRVVEELIKKGVDGAICMDEFITNMVLRCLTEQGIDIPGKIRLASLYDSQQMEYNIPPITSARFSAQQLGKSACMRILEMLGEEVDKGSELGYQVILRASTK